MKKLITLILAVVVTAAAAHFSPLFAAEKLIEMTPPIPLQRKDAALSEQYSNDLVSIKHQLIGVVNFFAEQVQIGEKYFSVDDFVLTPGNFIDHFISEDDLFMPNMTIMGEAWSNYQFGLKGKRGIYLADVRNEIQGEKALSDEIVPPLIYIDDYLNPYESGDHPELPTKTPAYTLTKLGDKDDVALITYDKVAFIKEGISEQVSSPIFYFRRNDQGKYKLSGVLANTEAAKPAAEWAVDIESLDINHDGFEDIAVLNYKKGVLFITAKDGNEWTDISQHFVWPDKKFIDGKIAYDAAVTSDMLRDGEGKPILDQDGKPLWHDRYIVVPFEAENIKGVLKHPFYKFRNAVTEPVWPGLDYISTPDFLGEDCINPDGKYICGPVRIECTRHFGEKEGIFDLNADGCGDCVITWGRRREWTNPETKEKEPYFELFNKFTVYLNSIVDKKCSNNFDEHVISVSFVVPPANDIEGEVFPASAYAIAISNADPNEDPFLDIWIGDQRLYLKKDENGNFHTKKDSFVYLFRTTGVGNNWSISQLDNFNFGANEDKVWPASFDSEIFEFKGKKPGGGVKAIAADDFGNLGVINGYPFQPHLVCPEPHANMKDGWPWPQCPVPNEQMDYKYQEMGYGDLGDVCVPDCVPGAGDGGVLVPCDVDDGGVITAEYCNPGLDLCPKIPGDQMEDKHGPGQKGGLNGIGDMCECGRDFDGDAWGDFVDYSAYPPYTIKEDGNEVILNYIDINNNGAYDFGVDLLLRRLILDQAVPGEQKTVAFYDTDNNAYIEDTDTDGKIDDEAEYYDLLINMIDCDICIDKIGYDMALVYDGLQPFQKKCKVNATIGKDGDDCENEPIFPNNDGIYTTEIVKGCQGNAFQISIDKPAEVGPKQELPVIPPECSDEGSVIITDPENPDETIKMMTCPTGNGSYVYQPQKSGVPNAPPAKNADLDCVPDCILDPHTGNYINCDKFHDTADFEFTPVHCNANLIGKIPDNDNDGIPDNIDKCICKWCVMCPYGMEPDVCISENFIITKENVGQTTYLHGSGPEGFDDISAVLHWYDDCSGIGIEGGCNFCACWDNDNDKVCDEKYYPTLEGMGMDNCPDKFNPYQEDSDGDGIGDACDNNNQGSLDMKNKDIIFAALLTLSELFVPDAYAQTLPTKSEATVLINRGASETLPPVGPKLFDVCVVWPETKTLVQIPLDQLGEFLANKPEGAIDAFPGPCPADPNATIEAPVCSLEVDREYIDPQTGETIDPITPNEYAAFRKFVKHEINDKFRAITSLTYDPFVPSLVGRVVGKIVAPAAVVESNMIPVYLSGEKPVNWPAERRRGNWTELVTKNMVLVPTAAMSADLSMSVVASDNVIENDAVKLQADQTFLVKDILKLRFGGVPIKNAVTVPIEGSGTAAVQSPYVVEFSTLGGVDGCACPGHGNCHTGVPPYAARGFDWVHFLKVAKEVRKDWDAAGLKPDMGMIKEIFDRAGPWDSLGLMQTKISLQPITQDLAIGAKTSLSSKGYSDEVKTVADDILAGISIPPAQKDLVMKTVQSIEKDGNPCYELMYNVITTGRMTKGGCNCRLQGEPIMPSLGDWLVLVLIALFIAGAFELRRLVAVRQESRNK